MPPYPKDVDPEDAEDVEDVEEVGLETTEEQPAEAPPAKTKLAMGNFSVDVDSNALPYFGVVVSAMVLLIAFTVPDGHLKFYEYGIAVTVVSMVFGLMGAFLTLKKKELYDRELGSYPWVGDITYGSALATFLFIWNFIAAGIFTFNDPFTVTSNGYFAAWGGVIFATLATGVTTQDMRSQAKELGYMNGLIALSIIQICAIIPEMGSPKDHQGEEIYSLIVSILSIVIVLAFGAHPAMNKFKIPIIIVFFILWVVLACLVTFRGPFLETGNGYFSGWGGCVVCVLILHSLKAEE